MAGLDLCSNGQAREDQARDERTPPRTRSIVFEAATLLAEVAAGERAGDGRKVIGKDTLRDLTVALRQAWRAGLHDLEDTPDELQARLLRGAYLPRAANLPTWRAALRLAHKLCPDLVVRVDRFTYLFPLAELRAGGARLERLQAWVDRTLAWLHAREGCGRRVAAVVAPSADSSDRPVDLSLSSTGPHAPSVPTTSSTDYQRALRDLRRLGPAVEGERGDHRTFVAAAIGGDYDLSPETWWRVLEEAYNPTCNPPWTPRELRKKFESAQRNRKRPWGYKRRSGEPPPDRRRASAGAPAAAVWDVARRLEDVEVGPERQWIERRGLDASEVAAQDLVRVLPRDAYHPAAEYERRSWGSSGYGLILQTVDTSGAPASVRARRTTTGSDERPKEITARGAVVIGTCYANHAARAMLAGDGLVAAELREERTAVWVAEGGPDFLAVATRSRAPVIGLFSGSWTDALAARVPDGATVLVCTHADAAGEALAATVARSLRGRARVCRLRWPGGLDVDVAAARGLLHAATSEELEPRPAAPEALAWLPPGLRQRWLELGARRDTVAS